MALTARQESSSRGASRGGNQRPYHKPDQVLLGPELAHSSRPEPINRQTQLTTKFCFKAAPRQDALIIIDGPRPATTTHPRRRRQNFALTSWTPHARLLTVALRRLRHRVRQCGTDGGNTAGGFDLSDFSESAPPLFTETRPCEGCITRRLSGGTGE
uniref:Uncharacterized protein n=1 Tax=Steinernema glaseri TaxID=37863 RepID=A0A1I7YMY4_9BILA